jgi:hypothetical protein
LPTLKNHERWTAVFDPSSPSVNRQTPASRLKTLHKSGTKQSIHNPAMERAVTRSELRSASASPSPPSDDEALQRLRNLNTLQFATKDVQMDDAPAELTNQDEDEEMMFQLFAPSKSAPTAGQAEPQPSAQKIRIRSPSVDAATRGFLQPSRPRSYHFTDTPSEELRTTYEAAALSGEQILELSSSLWPGSAYSWRVLHIPSSQVSRDARIASAQQTPAGFSKLGRLEAPSKRKRAGKKLRIKIRSKAEAAKAKQEAALKAKESKEEAEKEKRTRRNREKKVKRKAKEKAKKAEGGGDGPDGGDGTDVEESGEE